MKKPIELEFKDGFVPPERFSRNEGACMGCPFRIDNEIDPYCQLLEWEEICNRTIVTDDTCRIKKYFDNK